VIRFALRIVLIAVAVAYALPLVSGVNFKGDIIGALATSLVFNLSFATLEWLLGVVVLGINIGTLGLGFIVATGIKFLASLLAPSLALFGTAQLMPRFLHITNYFPACLVSGLMLGGLLWLTMPEKKKR
jgi:uncharacterized membrane protein YvlD (DUF360 family)